MSPSTGGNLEGRCLGARCVCVCVCVCVRVRACVGQDAVDCIIHSFDVPSPPQERLKALTDIVWPEIALLVQEQILQAREQGAPLACH